MSAVAGLGPRTVAWAYTQKNKASALTHSARRHTIVSCLPIKTGQLCLLIFCSPSVCFRGLPLETSRFPPMNASILLLRGRKKNENGRRMSSVLNVASQTCNEFLCWSHQNGASNMAYHWTSSQRRDNSLYWQLRALWSRVWIFRFRNVEFCKRSCRASTEKLGNETILSTMLLTRLCTTFPGQNVGYRRQCCDLQFSEE